VSSMSHGLALLAEGIEDLLAATAAPLDTAELLAPLRGLEVARRKIPAVDHQVLSQCAESGTAVAAAPGPHPNTSENPRPSTTSTTPTNSSPTAKATAGSAVTWTAKNRLDRGEGVIETLTGPT